MNNLYTIKDIVAAIKERGFEWKYKSAGKNEINIGKTRVNIGISINNSIQRIRMDVNDHDYENIINSGLNVKEEPLFDIYKYHKRILSDTESIELEKEIIRLENLRGKVIDNRNEIICCRYGVSEKKTLKKNPPHYIGVYSFDNFLKILDILALNPINVNISSNEEVSRMANEIREIEKELDTLNIKGEDKLTIVKTRVNQDKFRDMLLKKHKKCVLCGVSNKSFLRASHIKPWSESNSDEKTDTENGLLMCPNHDLLFDQGWISFDDQGKIIISDHIDDNDRIFMNINEKMQISVSEKSKDYLEYHRNNVYIG